MTLQKVRLYFVLLALFFPPFALARPRVYYQILSITPALLYYDDQSAGEVSAGRMACAAVHDPAPAAISSAHAPQSTVTFLDPSGIASCVNPAPYPDPGHVIALGRDPNDPDSRAVYGVLVRIAFFGTSGDPGRNAITDALVNYKQLRFRTGGSHGWWRILDWQASQDLHDPEYPISISAVGWVRITSSPFLAGFAEGPYWQEGTVTGSPGRWCRAGTWGLPLHVRLHGNENTGSQNARLQLRARALKDKYPGSPIDFRKRNLPRWCQIPDPDPSIRVQLAP